MRCSGYTVLSRNMHKRIGYLLLCAIQNERNVNNKTVQVVLSKHYYLHRLIVYNTTGMSQLKKCKQIRSTLEW